MLQHPYTSVTYLGETLEPMMVQSAVFLHTTLETICHGFTQERTTDNTNLH